MLCFFPWSSWWKTSPIWGFPWLRKALLSFAILLHITGIFHQQYYSFLCCLVLSSDGYCQVFPAQLSVPLWLKDEVKILCSNLKALMLSSQWSIQSQVTFSPTLAERALVLRRPRVSRKSRTGSRVARTGAHRVEDSWDSASMPECSRHHWGRRITHLRKWQILAVFPLPTAWNPPTLIPHTSLYGCLHPAEVT